MVQRVLDETQLNETANQLESRKIMRILIAAGCVTLLLLAGGLFLW